MSKAIIPVLKGRGLTKRYGKVVAMNHADFALFSICGTVIPDEGTIELEGEQGNFTSPIAAQSQGIEIV